MTTYARPYAFVDDKPVGSYTLHREYLALGIDDEKGTFVIIDDNSEAINCWWNGDPDCFFERIER